MKANITRIVLGAASLGLAAHFSVLSAQDGPRSRGEGQRQRPDMFKMADANEDGKVSLEEAIEGRKKMMAQRGGAGRRGPQGEGSPEREGRTQREGGPNQEEMDKRFAETFAKADADEDGFLTRQEFGQLSGGRGQRGGSREGGQGGEGQKRKRASDS